MVLLAYLVLGVGDTQQGVAAAATADGRLRFRIPATWQADPCVRVPDCLAVGPVGILEDDRVIVMILPADPHPVEGDPSLLMFDPVLGAGMPKYDLDGHPAVRVDELGVHLLAVLLDARGDRAIVLCPLDGTLHDSCDLVIGSLNITWP